MKLVVCSNCNNDFNLKDSDYDRRKRANINPELFCTRKCSTAYATIRKINKNNSKKTVVTTTAEEDLELWFASDIIVGDGLATTDNNTLVGEFDFTPKEISLMAQDDLVNKAIELGQTNPIYMDMTLSQIIRHIAQNGEAVEVSNATPIPQAPSQVPVQSNNLNPVQSNLVTPSSPNGMMRPAVWQDELDDKNPVNSVCDARFWDSERTKKMCMPNPDRNGQYGYTVDDPIRGLVHTDKGLICFRCQGKGYMTLKNIGYNWKTDIEYGIINPVKFSDYVASKNTNGVVIDLPADDALPQYKRKPNTFLQGYA